MRKRVLDCHSRTQMHAFTEMPRGSTHSINLILSRKWKLELNLGLQLQPALALEQCVSSTKCIRSRGVKASVSGIVMQELQGKSVSQTI